MKVSAISLSLSADANAPENLLLKATTTQQLSSSTSAAALVVSSSVCKAFDYK